jgi:HSP20 family protein
MYSQQATSDRPNYQTYAGCGGRARHWGKHFGHRAGPPWARQPVPVNIETTDASFVLTLFAAGLVKENIQLQVQDDVLTIAYQGADAGPETGEAAPDARYTRREFRNAAFERAFQLNGKVLVEGITAQYAEGILTVMLPKNPATTQPAQAIPVN